MDKIDNTSGFKPLLDAESVGVETEQATKYSHNILEGYGTGALLDLRVRMAIGFLNTSPIFEGLSDHMSSEVLPKACALFALELATELMAEAERRGLVEPLDHSGELPADLRKQAKLTACYQVLQQIEGQKFAQAETTGIAAPFPIAPGRPSGRH